MKKNIKKIVVFGILAILVLVVLFSSFTVVGAGNTGVVVTLGAVSDKVLSEGLHFKAPMIQQVVQINNRTQKIETEGSASSKDLQVITYLVAVNYRVDHKSSASLFKNIGVNYENVIITPAIQESIKAVTAQYTAEELITRRQEVSTQIKDALSEKIGEYGIAVEIFNIINFDFSEEFNAAVEAKQTAQQNALKAEQDLARIEIEAEQKVTQSEAEAKSIKLIQEALTASPDYVEYIKWNKWDGKLPTVMGDGDYILDIDSITQKEKEE